MLTRLPWWNEWEDKKRRTMKNKCFIFPNDVFVCFHFCPQEKAWQKICGRNLSRIHWLRFVSPFDKKRSTTSCRVLLSLGKCFKEKERNKGPIIITVEKKDKAIRQIVIPNTRAPTRGRIDHMIRNWFPLSSRWLLPSISSVFGYDLIQNKTNKFISFFLKRVLTGKSRIIWIVVKLFELFF